MTEKTKERIDKAMELKTVYWGEVTKLGFLDELPYMQVETSNLPMKCIIFADEAEFDFERKSLLPLMGKTVPFVVMDIREVEDTEILICSRKQAQIEQRAALAQAFADKTVLKGTIIDIKPYGAYIELRGVSGILKNADYMNVALPISEFLNVGDEIDVVCKNISSSGKIQWAPAVKPDPCELTYDVEVNTVVPGTVINMKPFETGGVGVFVRIGRGMDALCLLPQNMEVMPDDNVAVKIIEISPGREEGFPPRVKGKLVRKI